MPGCAPPNITGAWSFTITSTCCMSTQTSFTSAVGLSVNLTCNCAWLFLSLREQAVIRKPESRISARGRRRIFFILYYLMNERAGKYNQTLIHLIFATGQESAIALYRAGKQLPIAFRNDFNRIVHYLNSRSIINRIRWHGQRGCEFFDIRKRVVGKLFIV